MKKEKVLDLWVNLNKLNSLKGVKFSYGISKNIQLLKSEVEALQKPLETSESYNEYDKARIALAKEHSELDEKGKPKLMKNVKGQEEFVIKNKELWEVAFKNLKEEHKEAIDGRKKQLDDYVKLLEEEIEIKLHKIKLVDVPEDISVEQLNGIYEIIEE